MPHLRVLDLSDTSIKKLPPSIARLEKLHQFFLRDCELLTELPAEIRGLGSLKEFDLEGTRLIRLPKEIQMLLMLEILKVSLFGNAETNKEKTGIKAIIFGKRKAVIPRNVLSKCLNLTQLSIFVDTDSAWWEAELEALIKELPRLTNMKTLELFFPTPALMKKFSELQIYHQLLNFTIIVGHHEQHIISSLPNDLRVTFKKLKKSLVYVNGKGNLNVLGDVLEDVRALFLDRQWTIKAISEVKTQETTQLEFCVVVECNEMTTIIDAENLHPRISQLEFLRYLSVHYMKNLQSIWRGPDLVHYFSRLEILVLHTCPNLTTILNPSLLLSLVLLKELTVVNCPKVKSLVDVQDGDKSDLKSDSYFLPALKKIILIDLPLLGSITNGLPIIPNIENIFFSNCSELVKNLSLEEKNMYGKYLHKSKLLDGVGSCNNEIVFLRNSLQASHNDFACQTDQSALPIYTVWESTWKPIFEGTRNQDAWKTTEHENIIDKKPNASTYFYLYVLSATFMLNLYIPEFLKMYL